MSLELLGLLPENIEMEESNIFEKVKKVFRIPEILNKNKPKLIALESKTSSVSNPAITKPHTIKPNSKSTVKPARTVKLNAELNNKLSKKKVKDNIEKEPKVGLNNNSEIDFNKENKEDGKVLPILKAKEDFLYQPPVRRNK